MSANGVNDFRSCLGGKRAAIPDGDGVRDRNATRGVNDAPAVAPIDAETLLERCMGNIEFAESLLEEFAQSGAERIKTISRHVVEGDADAVAATSHALKGTAAMMAAEEVRSAAAALETSGRSGDLTDAHKVVSRLRDEMQRCVDHIWQNEEEQAERHVSRSLFCGR